MPLTAHTGDSRHSRTPMEGPHDGEVDSTTSVPKFLPLERNVSEIRRAIPPRLFVLSTAKAMAYLLPNLVMAAAAFIYAFHIPGMGFLVSKALGAEQGSVIFQWTNAILWSLYWCFQGLVFTGLWSLAHECGHNNFFASRALCDIVGFGVHSALLVPYWGWKVSHHLHHMNHASMERDETWIPLTRSEFELSEPFHQSFIEEHLGDMPAYTLAMLVVRQLIALPVYLIFNVSGNRSYSKWTNHFNPYGDLFLKGHRLAVVLSDFGVIAMACLLYAAARTWGWSSVTAFYIVPWAIANHWIVTITYLQHTDPELPHYRRDSWSFARGAAATMDRDFLGPVGRIFFHGIAHYHVVHHFFPKLPIYHAEEATRYLRQCLGDHYRHSDKPVLKAMWDNYKHCQFVEDTGSVLFYCNKQGQYAVAVDGY